MIKVEIKEKIVTGKEHIDKLLRNDQKCCFFIKDTDFSGATNDPSVCNLVPVENLYISHAVSANQLGAQSFRREYGVQYSYMAGAMAGGIAGEKHVIALGTAGFLSSFGAGGLPLNRVEDSIANIKKALPGGPFAVNLIHNTFDKLLEMKTVELCLEQGVTVIEASAFMRLTPAVVYYRAKGLVPGSQGTIIVKNRIIAKVSRQSVAVQFMNRAPVSIVAALLADHKITDTEARLLELVPVADDITVEADSGGHTDNLPLVNILPEMIQLRNHVQEKNRLARKIRIGAAGGISTPYAAHAAFSMGADYIVTGSINQSCVEASTSPKVKLLLSKVDVPDVTMAPAADMFELGVKVQVIKRGVFYPARASFLYELYKKYASLDELSVAERDKVELEIFKRSINEVWSETKEFFQRTAPYILQKADADPKTKMALAFRWYLGLSARWAAKGEIDRDSDYQVWCGPSMGAFNRWVKGTPFESPSNRFVAKIASEIMSEAAYLQRLRAVYAAGFGLC